MTLQNSRFWLDSCGYYVAEMIGRERERERDMIDTGSGDILLSVLLISICHIFVSDYNY